MHLKDKTKTGKIQWKNTEIWIWNEYAGKYAMKWIWNVP